MLHKPVLRGRLGKWAYTLVDYDLSYELLQVTKMQVVTDFIVNHMAVGGSETCLVELRPWRLFLTTQCVVGVVGSDVC
jgi:hypothetical protein